MANNFKKQAEQRRKPIPQLDPEATQPVFVQPPTEKPKPQAQQPAVPVVAEEPPTAQVEAGGAKAQPNLTQVDTTEALVNRGFHMYPSRHRQIAKDLAYIEDRHPWQVIEDALEEYVVKHYGKENKRK